MEYPEKKEFQNFNDKIQRILPKYRDITRIFKKTNKCVNNNIENLDISLNDKSNKQLKIIIEQANQIQAHKLVWMSIALIIIGGIVFNFFLTAFTTSPDNVIYFKLQMRWIWIGLAVFSFLVGYQIFRIAKEMYQTCDIIKSFCMEYMKDDCRYNQRT